MVEEDAKKRLEKHVKAMIGDIDWDFIEVAEIKESPYCLEIRVESSGYRDMMLRRLHVNKMPTTYSGID